jgi:hypothetical protein
MKLRLTLLLAVALHVSAALAKPSVVVNRFLDQMATSPCNIHKLPNTDLTMEMQRQMIAIFANHADLRVMNLEKTRTGAVPQYAVTGTVRSFDKCQASKPNDLKVKVAIEMRVIDNRTGNLAFTYTSSANASGSGSTLSQTAHVVLYDLAFRIERALINRKTTVHLVSKNPTKVAGRDYQVKLVRKDRAAASY